MAVLKALAVLLILIPGVAQAQAPYAPQAPVGPGPQVQQPPGPPPMQQPQQKPLEYAFRPNLTNPEYGECLQLEKGWQGLWQRYAQFYQSLQGMRPSDPQYSQTVYFMQQLKTQLDAAWNDFSSKCIYFPRR